MPDVPRRRLAGRPRRGAARRGWPRSRRRSGGGFGDAVGSAARQRPVRGAGVDARDDGHDPRPRPERRDRGRAGPRVRRARRSPGAAASGSRRASARSSASPTSPTIRGRSCGSRSRPSSARGTATAPGRIARRRASPTTSGRRSRSRRWSSATAARHRRPASLFTRNPATGEPTLYGDVLFDAQGEDVVAGTHATEPIAALDERLPAVAAELREHAARLEHHYADLCDIEFTIEDGRLWMLQVRVGKRSPQAALRIAVDMAEDAAFPLTARRGGGAGARRCSPIRRRRRSAGAGVVPPLVTGPAGVAGDGQRARSPRARRPRGGRGRGGTRRDPRPSRDLARRRPRHGPCGRHPDLARRPREPRRGRRARLGDPGGRRAPGISRFATARSMIGERVLAPGDVITIDGGTGEVFEGASPARPRSSPRRRRSSPGRRSSASRSAPMTPRRRDGRATPTSRGPVVAATRAFARSAIKGFAQPQGVADAVLADARRRPADPRRSWSPMVWSRPSAGALRLTDAGSSRAAELLADGAGRLGSRQRRAPRSTRSSRSTSG